MKFPYCVQCSTTKQSYIPYIILVELAPTLEISDISCHLDFMWNQKVKICHFNILGAFEFSHFDEIDKNDLFFLKFKIKSLQITKDDFLAKNSFIL